MGLSITHIHPAQQPLCSCAPVKFIFVTNSKSRAIEYHNLIMECHLTAQIHYFHQIYRQHGPCHCQPVMDGFLWMYLSTWFTHSRSSCGYLTRLFLSDRDNILFISFNNGSIFLTQNTGFVLHTDIHTHADTHTDSDTHGDTRICIHSDTHTHTSVLDLVWFLQQTRCFSLVT